jgi:quinol monooxygenase YgiN
MIVEYIRYSIGQDDSQKFVQAYSKASDVLKASPHCLGYEVSRCTEDPTSFVVRINWDSLEGHTQGFRTSPQFSKFFSDVRPFYNNIQEMRHYEVGDSFQRNGRSC